MIFCNAETTGIFTDLGRRRNPHYPSKADPHLRSTGPIHPKQEGNMFSAKSGNLKRIWVIGITLFILLAFTTSAMAKPGVKTLRAGMTGAKEAPGPGDSDGKGTASIRLDLANSEVCWNLKVKDIGKPTAAHIHSALPGIPGPVVVPLSPPRNGRSSGCTTAADALIMDILANPGNYYVNVHNAEFPAGAVRGQLRK
jgi:hypothetical protein